MTVTGRTAFVRAGVAWVALLLFATGCWAAYPFIRQRNRGCGACASSGYLGIRKGGLEPCFACGGTGGHFSFSAFGEKYVERILSARGAAIAWATDSPWQVALLGSLVLHMAVGMWLLRTVPCRRCTKAGRRLNGGAPAWLREEWVCPVCRGHGKLTALARWRAGA